MANARAALADPREVSRTDRSPLQASRDSLRILVDQFPAVFWTTDENLRFTSSLGAGLAALGLGPNQIVGMTLPDFFETDDSPTVEASRWALEGESVTYRMEWAGRAFQAQVAPLRDTQGNIIGTICVGVDVTDPDVEEWRFIPPG